MAQEAKTNFLHSVSSVGSAPQLAAICCTGVTPAYTSLSSGLFCLFVLAWIFFPLKTHLYCLHAFLDISANFRNVIWIPSLEDLNEVCAMALSPSPAPCTDINREGWTLPRAMHWGEKSLLRGKKGKKKKKKKLILPPVLKFDMQSISISRSSAQLLKKVFVPPTATDRLLKSDALSLLTETAMSLHWLD